MEQHLGRTLTPEESIHHINGNKQDNGIENLRLIDNSAHTTLHNKGNKYGKKDMSKRFCADCGSKTTRLQFRKNRPSPVYQWFRVKDGRGIEKIEYFRCYRCHCHKKWLKIKQKMQEDKDSRNLKIVT